MNTIFAWLFVVSIIALVVGLIKPKLFSKVFKKKTNRKTIGLVFGSAIVLFIILFGATSPSTGGTSTKNTTTPTSSSGSVSSATPTPTAQAVKENGIGDTITLRDHQLVVSSVNANFNSGNEFEKPQDPNNSFVVVEVNFTNTSKGNVLINEFGFKLEDETGTQRDPSFISGIQNELQDVTLSPSGKVSGEIAFEAKRDSSKLLLHYAGNGLLGNEVIIKLK